MEVIAKRNARFFYFLSWPVNWPLAIPWIAMGWRRRAAITKRRPA
jgi:hypothetical protein